MDIKKNKPLLPHLDENLKNNHITNGDEINLIIKKTIAKNKEIIEKNHKILQKFKNRTVT